MIKSFFKNLNKIILEDTTNGSVENYLIDRSLIKSTNAGDYLILRPTSVEELTEIMKICYENNFKVFPRGGGTSVTGAATLNGNGIVISLEKMNSILDLNLVDRTVTVDSGVIAKDLELFLESSDYFFPVLPSSKSECFIGGCVATNAGSPASARYGSIRQYVVNLEVVLPTGDVIWTGANVSKNSSGFDLTQLFIGSEGSIGIITKVVLKLLPRKRMKVVMLATFKDIFGCISVVESFGRMGFTPISVEVIFDRAFEIAVSNTLGTSVDFAGATSCLLIEIDGECQNKIDLEVLKINAILEDNLSINVYIAQTASEINNFIKFRSSVVLYLNSNNIKYRDIDICVPRSMLKDYIYKIRELCKQYQFDSVCFGHLMDGNLHIMIVEEQQNINNDVNLASEGILAIYQTGLKLGGVISGEHGIGILQRDIFNEGVDKKKLRILKEIKKVFDEKGIMNPGKLLK